MKTQAWSSICREFTWYVRGWACLCWLAGQAEVDAAPPAKQAEAAIQLQLAIEKSVNDKARAAIALAVETQKPASPAIPAWPATSQRDQYEALRIRAIRENKPLLVSVGCDCPAVEGCLGVRWDQFPGVKAPTIILGRPRGGELWQEQYKPAGSRPASQ